MLLGSDVALPNSADRDVLTEKECRAEAEETMATAKSCGGHATSNNFPSMFTARYQLFNGFYLS